MGVFATFEVMYRAQEFFLVFSEMSSFCTTLFLQNKLLNSHERFFFFTKIRPYKVMTFIRTTLWAFTLTLQKIDISISKMADSKWRIDIYEIKRFRSLKTLTRGFRNCWLRKWAREIDKMANWNLQGKQYWSLKFCTWEFFESLSTNTCVQYAKFFLFITKVNFH